MYISKLTIRNFRNFKNSIFHFNKGVNTIIGENGAGKTNTFYAIRLLLDNNLSINAAKLLESDFNREVEQWKGQWIIIKIEFDELNSSEGASMLAHKLEDIDEFSNSGSYCYYYRPKKRIRKQLYELSENPGKDQDMLNGILETITIDDYEVVYSFRSKADFSNDDIYKSFVGDFENIIFPNPEDETNDQLGIQTSQIFLIRNEIACTFIKALRNVSAEMKKTRQSPLLNLLRGAANDIQVEKSKDLTSKVSDLNDYISGLGEIKQLANRVSTMLNDTVGYTYAPKVSIKSELPEEITKLLGSLALWVDDGEELQHQGKLEDLSLGGANLIYITLKLLEYEYKQPTEEKAAHFLLIEEPEAHIHTHVQKTIFDKYQFENTQVITSTHSTHISSASKISSVNVLSKERNSTYVCNPSNGLTVQECVRIERYLDAIRSTLLFAKGIILVEGDAEAILIPAMFKEVTGLLLDEIGVSVVNVSSTVFTHVANLFHEDRIRRKCAIITDHDKSILPLAEDSSKDKGINKKFRNSQTKGQERKEALDKYCKDNDFIETFYAEHTFEIDFILEGNEWEITNCLSQIYKKEDSIEESKNKLTSDDDSVKGLEILRLADNVVGKGWFALLVAEHLSIKTYIPNYILNAISFASSHMGIKHLIKMGTYRVKKGTELKYSELTAIHNELVKIPENEITVSLLVELFEKHASNDQFLSFYKLLSEEM
ncbi:AAA family ATPase [Oceanobacillus manasiensis]|uniref:AAA family ATPase n=1 Tax=Oceanobacillus manasiensis TaxID=586413 RepID=UPI000694E0FA|nr:AAA family ATPase [Oceanobacillus manasiensis]